jgi:hypothetical protein
MSSFFVTVVTDIIKADLKSSGLHEVCDKDVLINVVFTYKGHYLGIIVLVAFAHLNRSVW